MTLNWFYLPDKIIETFNPTGNNTGLPQIVIHKGNKMQRVDETAVL